MLFWRRHTVSLPRHILSDPPSGLHYFSVPDQDPSWWHQALSTVSEFFPDHQYPCQEHEQKLCLPWYSPESSGCIPHHIRLPAC